MEEEEEEEEDDCEVNIRSLHPVPLYIYHEGNSDLHLLLFFIPSE